MHSGYAFCSLLTTSLSISAFVTLLSGFIFFSPHSHHFKIDWIDCLTFCAVFYILYIQNILVWEFSSMESKVSWKLIFIIFVLQEQWVKRFVQNALHLLNAQIGHALVHQKIGFFRFLVRLFSYLDQGFCISYVPHEVLLSPSFLIPPQSIVKDELWTGTKKESHNNWEWCSLM